MKQRIFQYALIFLFLACSSIPKDIYQSIDKNYVKNLISKLSWNSIEIATTYGTSVRIVGKEAIELEKLGKQVSSQLLDSFKNENKSVVIHLILTNLWEPEVNFLKVTHTNLPEADEVMVEYRINNFSWYKPSNENSRYSIDTVERDKIYEYWLRRIRDSSRK
ncbi:hypothetical protein H7U19_16305 [Hyunsoonleella sp. SJ7]|uniref:Uncharacterized protein n=1 Tax=Hyunsoonleella aquatilis TaxID=2762758 RepID=A0A923H9T8_9FLAO|nr:hypothetical protein [Hyunsoonleella aquatilis]MBC3759976.1 hypothetical protein [Hyunsoonleella aquatilis]